MTRPTVVLHVLDRLAAGGAEAVAVQLAEWSRGEGVDARVLGAEGPFLAEARRRVPVHVVPEGSPVARTLGLLRTCLRLRPDVLHAHQRAEALQCLLVGALLGVPVVEHAHTFLPRLRARALSFRSAEVFAVSPHVAAMVRRCGRRAGRLQVVGNVPARTSGRPVVPWRVPVGRPLRLAGVGRLAPQKDPARFVRIVAAASRLVPVEATWYGEGDLLGELRDLAERLGAPVHFAGHEPDVAGRLDESDALLLTSAWEGLPLVVLEAFARGRTVVATAACGSPGVLDEGRAVVVPDEADDEAAAHLLVEGLRDQAAADARHAAAAAWSAGATPEAVHRPVLDAYDRQTTGRRRGGPQRPWARRRG